MTETPMEPAAFDDAVRLASAYRVLLEQISEAALSGRSQALAERDATIVALQRELDKVRRELARTERRLDSITGAVPYRILAALRRLRPSRAPARGVERPSAAPLEERASAPAPPDRSRPSGGGRRHVLVADEHVPTPDRDSGSQRMLHLLRILVEDGSRVTFVPMDLTRREPYSSALEELRIEVLHDGRVVVDRLREIGPGLGAALLSRPPVALMMLSLLRRFAPRASIVFDTVDLHFVREGRRFSVEQLEAAKEAAERFQALETALAELCDAVVTTTDEERRILEEAIPGLRAYVIPNVHEVRERTPGFEQRRDVVFVGNFAHHPNRDAATYLVREVWPLVRKEIAGCRLRLAGYDPKGVLSDLGSDDVSVVGWVEDLDAYLAEPRVFAAPLRYGAGLKGKIGQALALGLPVVTTHIGAEGMRLTNGREALIVEDAPGFATAIARLYRDEALWRDLAQRGKDHVRANYVPAVIRRTVHAMLDELDAAAPSPSPNARS